MSNALLESQTFSLLSFFRNNPDINEEDVDEAVIDAALAMASNANNEGLSGQIEFLLIIAGWSEEDIRDYFKG